MLLASQISRLSGSDNGREAGGVFSDARGSDVVPGIGLGHATRPVTNLARLLLRVSPAMAAGVTDRLWSVEDLVALWEAYEQRRAERAA